MNNPSIRHYGNRTLTLVVFALVSDTVGDSVTLDARLAWRAGAHLEFSIVGQNLLDNHHPEFGTNPFVRSPLTEVRRAVYGQITFTW